MPSRRARDASLLLLAAVTAAGVGACSSQPRPDVPPEPALTGSVTQYRRDLDRRVLQVKLRADVERPVTVVRLRLEAPGFAPLPATDRTTTLPIGRPVDLPVPYGASRCAGGADPAAARDAREPVAVVGLAGGREVRVPLADPTRLLRRLQEADCIERALAEAADLGFDDTAWTASSGEDGAALGAVLQLRRRSGEVPVVVQDISSNVLFTVRAPGASRPLLRLTPGTAEVPVPLEVRATRCDGHALAENKRSHTFRVYAGLGDTPPRGINVRAGPAGRRALDALALRTCRPGG